MPFDFGLKQQPLAHHEPPSLIHNHYLKDSICAWFFFGSVGTAATKFVGRGSPAKNLSVGVNFQRGWLYESFREATRYRILICPMILESHFRLLHSSVKIPLKGSHDQFWQISEDRKVFGIQIPILAVPSFYVASSNINLF